MIMPWELDRNRIISADYLVSIEMSPIIMVVTAIAGGIFNSLPHIKVFRYLQCWRPG